MARYKKQVKTPAHEDMAQIAGLFEQNRLVEAESAAKMFITRFPDHGFGWKALGAILVRTGNGQAAFEAMQRAVQLVPHDHDLHNNLGILYKKMGRGDDAIAAYRTCLEIMPDYAEAHNNLGTVLRMTGHPEEAVTSCRRALELKPDYAEAHNNLGIVLRELGSPDEAESCYHRALVCRPGYGEALYNLGNLCKAKGRLHDAVTWYRQALQQMPGYAEAYNNLGTVLKEQWQLSEAVTCYRQALTINPGYAEALNNLGVILHEQGRLQEAVDQFKQALSIRPEYVEVSTNWGAALKDMGRLWEAQAPYRQAMNLDPHDDVAVQGLATVLAYLSEYRDLQALGETVLTHGIRDQRVWEQRLYAFSYHPDLSAEEIFAEFVRWGDRFSLPSVDFSGHDRTPGRRLRVGYVSPDFRRHTSRFYFMPLFANHDKAQVELFAYSNVNIEDGYTEKFRGIFDHWRNIRGVSKEDAAAQIKADGIDILVDCCNHMADDRLDIFTIKPAPIQVTWLGAAWTTGLAMVDYVLFDPYIAPEGTLTREEIIRLPHFFVAYQPPEETAEVKKPPCLKNGFITFGYSGRTERLNHKTFRVWGEILRQVPDARLILDYKPFSDPPTQEHYRRFMTEHGMDPGRVIMRNSKNIFEGLGDIDILLDCFPHSGGTMLFDALWLGVPVLTLASRPPVGRIGTSLMTNLGLPEWVAQTEEEYIAKAVAFAAQPNLLNELRRTMRQRMQDSPVMDGKGFAQGVEQAYHQMWGKWCGGSPAIAEPSAEEINRLIQLFNRREYAVAEQAARELTLRYPDNGFGWKALGTCLIKSDVALEALEAMQKAAELLPNDYELYRNLGVVLQTMYRFDEAIASYRQALEIRPDYAEAYTDMGTAFLAQGRPDAAESCLRHAAGIKPAAETFYNLANLLRDSGRLAEATDCYYKTLELKPDHVEAFNNLGVTLKETGDLKGALKLYHRALQIKPEYVQAHTNLGVGLKEMGQLNEAEACFRRAFEIAPDFTEALSNLAAVLQQQGRLDEAEECLRRCLLLQPDYAPAYNNLGNVLEDRMQLDEAEVYYHKALALKPDFEDAFSNLLFVLNYHSDRTAEEIFAAYREYDARFGLPLRTEWLPYTNTFEADRRLKIGYVSPDFRLHSCRHFLEPLLAVHDKTCVEVFAYADVMIEDAMTARYRGYTDHFLVTTGMTDAALAAQIRNDGIGILVDLAGHTAHNRLGVFARKPAPVSATWLGYGYTTGLSAIDYILTDAVSAPEGSEYLFSEIPWRLETPGYAYRPAEGMGEVNSLPALERGFVTFGTLTRAVRINHHTVRVWSEILKRVPSSRLVIDSRSFTDTPMQDRLAEQFSAHGIERQRLEIGFHSPPWDILRSIDISLDCFPHNSGTTLFESLYMGVPFISLAGRPSVGRIGSSVLEGAGHPEWIAATQEEYIAKAAALASDLPKLAAIRNNLRNEMKNSLLMNEDGFARKVEAAYRQMWEKWRGGDSPPIAEPPATELERLVKLFQQGDYTNAELSARALTARYPQNGFSWKALGAVLQHRKKLGGALVAARRAVELLSTDAEAHNNLGVILQKLLRFEQSEPCFSRAVQIRPDYAEAYNNLGATLKRLNRLAEAELAYRKALTIQPDYAEAHNNLGSAFKDQGRLVEAGFHLRRALELLPSFGLAHQGLSLVLAYLSDYRQVVEESDVALQLSPEIEHLHEQRLYAFSYHPDLTANEIFGEFVRWGDRFPVPVVDFSSHDRTPGRRLRVGYVSPDFRKHTSRFYFMPLFANHDKTEVELFAYSNVNIEDAFTDAFKGVFDHWRNIRGVSKEDAAALIKADGIDILVDCCNHMMDDRLDIFTLKPAPIQVTWLGAAWTTGLPMVDYVLFDPYIAPAGTLTREEIVRLPHFFVAYQPPEETAEVKEPPCLKNRFITFGYSGRTERLNHKTFRVWGEILRQLPDAKVILDFKPFSDPPTQEHYRQFMQQHGMDPGRVIMRKSENIFEGLGDIDILLDCFPHSGGTMLFDALWMGVPALTLASRPPVGRIGTSLLTNLGLPEWVAQTEEEYIAKAVAFAAQPNLLSELRRTMRQRMQDSPVMDGKGFAQGVEQAYREMWGKWCGG